MSFGRLRDPDRPPVEPFLNLLPGLPKGLGALENAGIGHETQKTQKARPGEAQRFETLEFFIEPAAGSGMLFECGNMGIDKEVCVDDPHLKFSPSAMARTSARSSILPIRHRPKDTDRVW